MLSISIHAPRVGSDAVCAIVLVIMVISIHAPRVGSDLPCRSLTNWMSYFNPRSPCGERQYALRAAAYPSIFQSTLPVWGATEKWPEFKAAAEISIHAPRVGSDDLLRVLPQHPQRFQSTLPVWGATLIAAAAAESARFQSTLPVWGATSV